MTYRTYSSYKSYMDNKSEKPTSPYVSYMSYKSYKKPGGYKSLIVYQLATTIYDLNYEFCQQYLLGTENRRTREQMIHAARSGKQNIVEGSLEKSVESNIKLTGVSRASYGELLEDFKDFLRIKKLPLWDRDDSRVSSLRALREDSYKTYKTYKSYMTSPEFSANLLITLCFKQGYLLDQLLRSQEKKFVETGGFRENLFKKRIEYRKS